MARGPSSPVCGDGKGVAAVSGTEAAETALEPGRFRSDLDLWSVCRTGVRLG